IVCQAGAKQELGTAAMTMTPDQLDSSGRTYVPNNPKIITATKMLEAGESARLPVRALPPGDYEYVCTFPGHWTLMWGKIIAR
ncbi:MAG: plastocyanin/azurin family copper-binding protein, partial [Verrucomicrobiales bacterium]|nr:plastocyanin/azurin family copper-binding protein [Verrucomicrobiales bacterium]